MRFSVCGQQASICTAETLLPKFEYFERKCTRSYTRTSAGFWPHFKQGEVLAEPVILRNLVRFGICSPLVCHFQELKPAPDDYLQAWPVSRQVNSSRAPSDDPALIEPLAA